MNKRLVILSVPIIRLSRVLLSDHVLGSIKRDADVLIVSPFSNDMHFCEEFGGPNIFFNTLNPLDQASRITKKLYAMSELLRRDGYYCRYRFQGLAYYWANISTQYGMDGQDLMDSLIVSIVKKIIGVVGMWRKSWRILDGLIGLVIFRSKTFDDLVSKYDDVTLVQSASWGEQDRMLGWNARQLGFRSVFVPYTTDQLWVSGHLLCDYDAICVQGPFEARCAKDFHNIPESRIAHLGSMWFRAIDTLVLNQPTLQRQALKEAPRVVIYAGLSRTYSSQASEFQAVDALIAANQEGLFGHTNLVYRPYAMTPEERRVIQMRYDGADLQLQWPEEVCAGLYTYSGGVIKAQLLDYLQHLVDADLLIMTQITSMGWDAAYMGCGVIANFSDGCGVLAQRRTDLFLQGNELDYAPGMPIANAIPELILQVQMLLNDKKKALQSGAGILDEWDYLQQDSQHLLRDAIFGQECTTR